MHANDHDRDDAERRMTNACGYRASAFRAVNKAILRMGDAQSITADTMGESDKALTKAFADAQAALREARYQLAYMGMTLKGVATRQAISEIRLKTRAGGGQ